MSLKKSRCCQLNGFKSKSSPKKSAKVLTTVFVSQDSSCIHFSGSLSSSLSSKFLQNQHETFKKKKTLSYLPATKKYYYHPNSITITTAATFLFILLTFNSNPCLAQDVSTNLKESEKIPRNTNPNSSHTTLFTCSELSADDPGRVGDEDALYFVSAQYSSSSHPLTFMIKSGFGGCSSLDSFNFVMNTNENYYQHSTDSLSEQEDNTPEEEAEEEINEPVVFLFEANGLLRLNREYFSPAEYCVQQILGKNIVSLRICNATCRGNTPCLSKCCSIGRSLDCTGGDCGCLQDERQNLKSGLAWQPKMFESSRKEVEDYSSIHPHIVLNRPCRFPNGTTRYDDHETWTSVDVPELEFKRVPMKILRDGRLTYLKMSHAWEILDWDAFCMDDIWTNDSGSAFSKNAGLILLQCSSEEPDKNKRLSILYIVAMYISSFFLFLTALVYALLWDKHNIHGWTVLFMVTSTGLLYIFLGISHTLGLTRENTQNPTFFCTIIGIITHFFFVSTFSWLTCINYDLMTTFRSHKPVGERSRGGRRFVFYNFFAWGIASIVVTVGITLDNVYPDVESDVITPQYGFVNCFIIPHAMGWYVYIVIGALMAVNLVFIGLTLWTIYWFRKSTSMIQNSHSGRTQQSFKLFSKLFVIMGVTWILEIVSWLQVGERSVLHWTLLDCVNILQAISIFVIFVCKAKILKQLQQKFSLSDSTLCCFKLKPTGSTHGTETRTTGTSKQSSFISTKTLTTKT